MFKKTWQTAAVAAGLTLGAACAQDEVATGVVARAGDLRLGVDETVQLLADHENLPNDIELVRAVADLWADYALLAHVIARDSTLGALDLEPLVRQQLDQEMIFLLRDSVIQVDTLVSDDELREVYERESPESELRASHILLTFPEQSTQAERDSVRAEMETLRRRALAGEDFAALARRHSQDPGSGPQGGDLGTFSRGDMVKPFEDAAFALQPGEISQVVESPYGLHLIRLDSRRAPGFDQVRDQFRMRLLNQRFLQAESAFVAGVEERGSPQIQEGAGQIVRELAKDPSAQLSRRAGDRTLVRFEGGAVTVRDYVDVLQGQQASFRQQVQSATDEQLDNFLRGLAQRELLVAEAARGGLAPSRERVDSLVAEARQQLLAVAGDVGLRSLDQAPGETVEVAVQRAVRRALGDVLAGAADPVPLGPISYQLRSRTPITVFETGLGEVVVGVGRIRAARVPAAGEPAPDTAGTGG